MTCFSDIQFSGLIIGISTFLIIGAFHPIVIKCEYYFGTKCWWLFLILGLCGTVASVLIADIFWSALIGVFAFSSFWTIKEIFEQEERVLKGWFPMNPKRAGHYKRHSVKILIKSEEKSEEVKVQSEEVK